MCERRVCVCVCVCVKPCDRHSGGAAASSSIGHVLVIWGTRQGTNKNRKDKWPYCCNGDVASEW